MAAFRYYQFTFTAGNATAIMVAEVELIGLATGVDVTSPATTVTADGQYSAARSYTYTVANDGTTNGWQYNAVYPHWLRFDLGAYGACEINGYTLQADPQNTYAPTAWTLYGSNDASNWIQIDSQTGQSFAASEIKAYTLAWMDRKVLSGQVLDAASNPAKRVIRLVDRASGAVVAETESNVSTGNWSIDTLGHNGLVTAQALDVDSLEKLKTLVSLPMTGANGSTTFIDHCGNPGITAVGNAQITTVNYPPLAGVTSSGLFDGTGDAIQIQSSGVALPSPQLAVGTDDFCVDVWCRLTSNAGDLYRELLYMQHGSGTIQIRYGNSGFGYKLQVAVVGSAVANIWSCAKTQTTDLNTWQLLSFERYRGVCRLYAGGTIQSINSGANPSTYPVTSFADTTNVNIGCFFNLGITWTGNIGPFRFLRYAPYKGSNFTAPTAPWPDPLGTPENALITDAVRAA